MATADAVGSRRESEPDGALGGLLGGGADCDSTRSVSISSAPGVGERRAGAPMSHRSESFVLRRAHSMSIMMKRTVRLVAHDPHMKTLLDPELVAYVLLIVVAYGVAVASPLADGLMWPQDGVGWALFVTWVVANASGRVLGAAGLPPLAGQLLGGVLVRNSRMFHEAALTGPWKATIRSLGLGVIMMRSGLELDVDAIRRAGVTSLRLTVLPGVSEACAVGAMGVVVFQFPVMLSLSMGFILAAVSPAVVVVGMFDLHQRGFGRAKGIPSIVVAAASMDDIVAMLGFSVCIGLAGGHGTVAENALHGPVAVLCGFAYGVCGGAFVACTKIWDCHWKLTLVTLFTGLLPMFVAESLHAHGGGAIGALFTGLFGSIWWRRGGPCEALSSGPDDHTSHIIEHNLADLWGLVAQPLLFGAIGTELNFWRMEPVTIAKALSIILVGVGVRIPAAYVAVSGDSRLVFREKAFNALSWLPKATVQAALASVPMSVIHSEERGNNILTTAVLAILVTAPLGSLIIQNLGPRWLTDDSKPAKPPATKASLDAVPDAVADADAAVDVADVEMAQPAAAPAQVAAPSPGAGAPRHDEHAATNIEMMEPMFRIDGYIVKLRDQLHALEPSCDADQYEAVHELHKLVNDIGMANLAAEHLLTYKMPTTKRIDTAGNFFKLQQSENAETAAPRKRRSSFKMKKGRRHDGGGGAESDSEGAPGATPPPTPPTGSPALSSV